MDESVQLKLTPQVGTLKLSDVVRECGYGRPGDFTDCVLGRALTHICGASWWTQSTEPYTEMVARLFSVPKNIVCEAESMCFMHESPARIADWLESLGF